MQEDLACHAHSAYFFAMTYTVTQLLRRRILLYAACALLALSGIVVVILGIPLLESWRHTEEILLQATARNKAVSIEAWLRHAEGVAWHIAGRTDIRNTLAKLNNPSSNKAGYRDKHQDLLTNLHESLKSSLRQNGDILGISLVGNHGQGIVHLGLPIPESLWAEASFNATSPAAALSASPQLRILSPQTLGNEECLFFAVPVHNDEGNILASLLIARRMTFLHRILQEEHAHLHDEVVLGLQSTHGFSYISTAEAPSIQSDAATAATMRADVLEALAAARAGKDGVISCGDMVIAYAPVGTSGWAVSLLTPAPRLYAPAIRHFWALLPWIIAAYGFILGGFWLLSRPLAGRILLHTHELEAEVSQRRQAEASLQTALQLAERENLRRKQLATELINILEAMRQSLASDLHDHVGQTLTTLLLHLENSATDKPTAQSLLAAATSVRHIQQQLRDIAKGLRPQTLDILGLIAALKSLCVELQQGGLVIHFFYEGCTALRSDMALALYRIAQGALTNVVRHSKADTVHISLVERDDTIVLTVEDNGQGFDVQKKLQAASLSCSLGLTLMQERLAPYNGHLHLESSASHGTLIMAELPLTFTAQGASHAPAH